MVMEENCKQCSFAYRFFQFFFPVKQTEREEKIIIIESTNWGSEKAQQKERLGHEWLHTRWKKKISALKIHEKRENYPIYLFCGVYSTRFIFYLQFSFSLFLFG